MNVPMAGARPRPRPRLRLGCRSFASALHANGDVQGVKQAMKIQQVGPEVLPFYATVSIAFEVDSQLCMQPVEDGLGGILLHEEPVVPPYKKDYDLYEEEGPVNWPRQFDLSNWAFFLAMEGGCPVGAATVAMRTPGVRMLAGRNDLAVLWDIRVQPAWRGRGVGRELFWVAANWSRERGARQFKIETQNNNVRACRFYAGQGCQLGEIRRYAYVGYPGVEHEVMLIWYLDL